MGKRYSKILLLLLIGLWTLLAITRSLLNISKLYTEERHWISLNDEQMREKQFGEKYNFLTFVKSVIPPHSNILLFTTDGMTYYLARYFLYPTTVIWGERQYTEWGNDIVRNYSYAIFYPLTSQNISNVKTINNTNFHNIKEFRTNGKLNGLIYKK